MQNTPTSPNPVYVYPLPAKTQGAQGDSKAYRISLGILWFCFVLPMIGTIFDIGLLLLSYISTNIFIIFFIIYFKFYKNAIFLGLLLLTAVLILPAAYTTQFLTPFAPIFSPKTFGDIYQFIELNFAIGSIFFIFFHLLNAIMIIIFKRNIKYFITPILLCETSSLFFYIIVLGILNFNYEKVISYF